MARMMQRRPMSSQGASPGGGAPDARQPPRVEVPKHNVDPVWSLCPWPLVITTHGQIFEVPAEPAVTWIKHLMPTPKQETDPDLLMLLDELLPTVDDFWFDSALPPEELYELIQDIITTVAARPWWLTLRMMAVASSAWHILGPKMIMNNGDPTKLSLAAWLDLLMYLIMDSVDPEKATMFVMQLEAPPAGLLSPEEEQELVPPMEQSLFLAMAAD